MIDNYLYCSYYQICALDLKLFPTNAFCKVHPVQRICTKQSMANKELVGVWARVIGSLRELVEVWEGVLGSRRELYRAIENCTEWYRVVGSCKESGQGS